MGAACAGREEINTTKLGIAVGQLFFSKLSCPMCIPNATYEILGFDQKLHTLILKKLMTKVVRGRFIAGALFTSAACRATFKQIYSQLN